VVAADPDASHGSPAAPAPDPPSADVYLLKTRTPRALALAHRLERRGARVLNSASATELCQDRARMAEVAGKAGLPFPRTRAYDCPSRIAGDIGELGFPLMVKSRRSARLDVVARIDDREGLSALARSRPGHPVVVQRFVENDGWDRKLWVVDTQVYAGLRPTPLADPLPVGDKSLTEPLDPADVPEAWTALALRAGRAFGLQVYGVDLIERDGAPVIVDVNAFPGMRGMDGAPEALAALAVSAGSGR
jgi:ribosomal protein S6--L-glutamate ligase